MPVPAPGSTLVLLWAGAFATGNAESIIMCHFGVTLEADVSTTTLRVPDTLRARIATLAKESEQTQHGLMLELLARGVEDRELRAAFHNEGKERLSTMIESGMVIPWEEMRAYMLARAKAISQGSRGEEIKKPKARKWRKSS